MVAEAEIAVFRATPALGDLLLTVPAPRALASARPDSRISLIAQLAATGPDGMPVECRCLRDSRRRIARDACEVPPSEVGVEEVIAAASRPLAGRPRVSRGR